MNTLIEFLKRVKDFRSPRGRRHPLWQVLLVIVLGIMTGNVGYRAWAEFAQYNQKALRKYWGISQNTTPSFSTIRRVMRGIDSVDLIDCFQQLMTQLKLEEEDDWIAIDGKSLKATVKDYYHQQQNFATIVSSFCPRSGLVLALKKGENKKDSEIDLVRDMVKVTPLTNKVFTLDALHCQKQTVQDIIESGNDYLIAVKKNQPSLYKQLQVLAQYETPLTQSIEFDSSKGRRIQRKVSVFSAPGLVQQNWLHSQALLQVERKGRRGNKPYYQQVYYLSSRLESAQLFSSKIQEHWQIENRLHWVKDVLFQEDSWPLREFVPATNVSIFSTVAINLFRFLGFLSVTQGQRWLRGGLWRLWVL